jgi:hypothetical protein
VSTKSKTTSSFTNVSMPLAGRPPNRVNRRRGTFVWELAADGDQRSRVSQTYDWSAFTHLDMLDYLPVVDETQLRSSLDKLADALGCSGRSQTDEPG